MLFPRLVAKPPAETLILLVEDDPDQATLGELRLTLAGYKVRTVGRAKQLSRALREEARPDLLLLDVVLPDGNGFDILDQLRGGPAFATLPIVLLTVKVLPCGVNPPCHVSVTLGGHTATATVNP